MGARLTAFGGHVPPNRITNKQISEWTGRSPDWILDRTGIEERRYAPTGTTTSDLAYRAVVELTERSPEALEGLTQVILATSTPDRHQPAAASRLHYFMDLPPAVAACDINAVCAGWLHGLKFAAALTDSYGGKVLLVAADKYSEILNRQDPTTVSLFGDGAAAVVIEPGSDSVSGLRSLLIANHGLYFDLVTVRAGGSELPTSPKPEDYQFQMKGREVKEYVRAYLPPLISDACEQAGVRLSEIGALICHQANVRLIHELADTLRIDRSHAPLTAPFFGNVGAASLPLTLWKAQRANLLTEGRPVVLCAVGGGMSVAAGVYVP